MDQAWCSLALFLIIFLLFAIKLFLHKRIQSKKLPPSPLALPIIGHLHLLSIKQPLHRTLHSLSDRYGPILLLRFGSRLGLVVSSPLAVEECFTKNDVIFANRPRVLVSKYLNYDYTTLAAASYGHHWRNLRRLTALEIFSSNRLNMFAGIRQEEIRLLLGKLFRNSREGFVKVELKTRLEELSLNIIMMMIAGKRYCGENLVDFEEARRFREIVREIFELTGTSNLGDFFPVLHWIDYQGLERRMLALRRRTDESLQGLVDEHRNRQKSHSSTTTHNGETKKTMIDALLPLQEAEPEYYTDDVIKGIMQTLIAAGTDTSAVTIEWAMSLLFNHPEMMKKARDELDIYVGHDRLVVESDLPKLLYLQSIINETLRLFPAVPLLVPHESSEDCTVGGFNIPRGTMLFVNAWAIHRDPKLWEDAMSFKPERFEGAEGEPHRLIPFGLGRRACPGVGLANRVVGLALASLIQCFEWERVGEEKVDMTEGIGLTMPKAKPLEAMCKGRPAMINILSQL